MDKDPTQMTDEQISNTIISEYDDGLCPDCEIPIVKDIEEGEACENCGHVFWLVSSCIIEEP
jgi:hypothetical protein